MNEALFTVINNLAGQWSWLDQVGIFFAHYFIYVFAALILVLWFEKGVRSRVYLAIFAAGVSRLVVAELIKRAVNHPRPFEVVPHVHQLLFDEGSGMSFPSGHTVVFFSFAFAFYGTRYFWPFLILAVLGSISRIFVGVHFPADVLGGILVAGLVTWLLGRLFKNQFLR